MYFPSLIPQHKPTIHNQSNISRFPYLRHSILQIIFRAHPNSIYSFILANISLISPPGDLKDKKSSESSQKNIPENIPYTSPPSPQVISMIWLFSFLSASPWALFTKVLQPQLQEKSIHKKRYFLLDMSCKAKESEGWRCTTGLSSKHSLKMCVNQRRIGPEGFFLLNKKSKDSVVGDHSGLLREF